MPKRRTGVTFEKTVNQYGEFYSFADFTIQKLRQATKYQVSRDWGDLRTSVIAYTDTLSHAKKIIRTIWSV